MKIQTCRGAKIDYVSPVLGLSAMHMALLSGSEDILDALIEMGARLEDTRLCNRDAERIAVNARNTEAVRYLQRRQDQKAGAQRLVYPRTQIG